MNLPKPGPEQAKLMRFAGHWSGAEQVSPSPFGPGGAATGRTRFREDLAGMALIQEYEQEKDGAVVFRGHGVFLVEPDSGDVLWWWFDDFGFPPDPPARGRWSGEVLEFSKSTPRGEARYRYELDGDRYRFVIENRFPGQPDFAEFMRGDYTRRTA
ncbi:DUF1579 family protein [Luteimonas aquatica]|uniref:DUF1579 family protein n=1 Tax=Luteimonas aquatica TaxID=450364 RepID=UPI001F5948BB|nr:DUF1579 family protein [Luteimonas aquatica]